MVGGGGVYIADTLYPFLYFTVYCFFINKQ